ncbi:MAG TPA: ATPase [Gammaproteobacteria bacterium]|nr:ATPase [Gammaproteobacteria bacterium]
MMTKLSMKMGLAVNAWSVTDGLWRADVAGSEPIQNLTDPESILVHIKSAQTPSMFVLCDFHPYLDEPKLVRLVKDIALAHKKLGHTLVFLSHKFEIPAELKRLSAVFDIALPDEAQLLNIVREEATKWSKQRGSKVKTDRDTLQMVVRNLMGLSFEDARRLARGVIADDGAITQNDIPEINKAKFKLLDMEGVLSFEYDTANFKEVAGLVDLKEWLALRHDAFFGEKSGVDTPKGVMLLGVQGGGKSLAAKAVAGSWSLPLLRLDFACLYNKFFGESERNLREALKMAELMAPCVLWIDEIEKGLGQNDTDNGTSQRILGTLLTWMAERKQRVFIVATSNDISQLPPELVRKGRLDEIFFVDLPEQSVREAIFEIHFNKRQCRPTSIDLSQLALLTAGFTGAEIEQVVVSSLYCAAAEGSELGQHHLVSEIQKTSPLSVVMAEEVAKLRQWAEGRAVAAG